MVNKAIHFTQRIYIQHFMCDGKSSSSPARFYGGFELWPSIRQKKAELKHFISDAYKDTWDHNGTENLVLVYEGKNTSSNALSD